VNEERLVVEVELIVNEPIAMEWGGEKGGK